MQEAEEVSFALNPFQSVDPKEQIHLECREHSFSDKL